MATRAMTAVFCMLAATAAGAEVKLTRLADGSLLMSNDGSRRSAASLAATADIERLIDNHARRQQLDPRLVHAVVRVESGYDPVALSRKGAMGLMQLMPDTARALGVDDPYDPDQNLRGGTAYLRQLLDRFRGNLELALAGYNAGPEAVDRYRGLPPYPETRGYVGRVLGLFRGQEAAVAALRAAAGRPTYVLRDAGGRLVMTTSPPAR